MGLTEGRARTALPVTFHVTFSQAARAELIDAQNWYAGEAEGLGRHFREAVAIVVDRIAANPLQFPVVYKNARRALLRRFPYMLFFTVEGDSVFVIACFHGSRDPRQWQQRI